MTEIITIIFYAIAYTTGAVLLISSTFTCIKEFKEPCRSTIESAVLAIICFVFSIFCFVMDIICIREAVRIIF